jgi:two-component system, NarL family, response regulator LiaR
VTKSATTPLRVLLVDDHRVFAEALEFLLAGEDTIELTGAVARAEDAFPLVRDGRVDLVLMDVDLPGMDGIEATRELKAMAPHVQVVMITAYQERRVMARAIEAGASAFVPKTQAFEVLLEMVTRAAAGEKVMPLMTMLAAPGSHEASRVQGKAERLLGTLTSREMQVLQAIADGATTSEIAQLLWITPLTVQTHVKNILSKLEVHSKAEAVALALRFNAIPISSRA